MAEAVLHDGLLTRAPPAPHAQEAIHPIPIARIIVACLQLLEGACAGVAATRSLDLELPGPCLQASTAALRAARPLRPVLHLAVDDIFAGHRAGRGFLHDAIAHGSAIPRVFQDLAGPEALLGLGATVRGVPGGPVTERAIHGLAAVLLTPLRLEERTLAEAAAALGLHADGAAPLAKLCASGLRPRGPCGKVAVALLALALTSSVGALIHLDLVPIARAVGARHEEGAIRARTLLDKGELPLPHLRGVAAGSAVAHRFPLRPDTEVGLLARTRAFAQLLGIARLALLATVVGERGHRAMSEALPATLRAVPPVGPQSPSAVAAVLMRA
mmetsp:Transcript_47887/g.102648  ORF Transcript_47887/g.102648 Transcript_47887/m.102648 type:complete len:329 (+) Transcript_47887:1707-2693(+)